MKPIIIALLGVSLLAEASQALAHPGSGIVVDRQGNIYFVDTGSGVWKIDRNGKLSSVPGPAYHWMAIDVHDRLTKVTLPSFSAGGATVTRVDIKPSLLLASDFPIAVGPDGHLYYPWLRAGKQLEVFRLAPSGTTTILSTLPESTESGPLRWLNGIVAARDGSVYYTENNAVRRITPQGKLITIAANLALSDCDTIPGVGPGLGPYLRGLDVDAQGNVYVAATGCGAVLKIASDNKAMVVLRTQSPWSPTGVAVFGNDLYVLEYLHTEGDNRREWPPRVRKLASDGSVLTIATIDRQ